MDYPKKFLVSNQKEEPISIQRVKCSNLTYLSIQCLQLSISGTTLRNKAGGTDPSKQALVVKLLCFSRPDKSPNGTDVEDRQMEENSAKTKFEILNVSDVATDQGV